MLIIKATKTMMKDLSITPVNVDISNLFYSWHANYFTLDRRKHYVFMNDLTRLSLTIAGIRSNQLNKLQDIFRSSLKEYLQTEGISTELVEDYVTNCNEVIYTKTDSRSVLSTLSEIMMIMKSFEVDKEKEFADLNERNRWNNTIIYKPIDYNKPIDVFKKELEKQFR